MELLSSCKRKEPDAAWSDADTEDKLMSDSSDKHWTFLLDVANFMQIDFATLVAGKDNGRRAALPWCVNENRIFRGNTLRLTNDLVRARDKAYSKLRQAGLVLDMDDLLTKTETHSIFVHVASTLLAYDLEIQDVKKDLASLFTRHPALRRRPDDDVPHMPFWKVNQLM